MTAVNPEPRAPGEIGWAADASEPGDPSVPAPGSGGAKAEDLPELSPPTITDDAVDAVVVDDEPAPEPEAPIEHAPDEEKPSAE